MSDARGAAAPAVLPSALRAALPLYLGLGVTTLAAFAFKAFLVARVFDDPAEMGVFETYDRFAQGLVTVALLGLPAGVLRLTRADPERAREHFETALALAVCAFAVAAGTVTLVPHALELVVGSESDAWLPFVARAALLVVLSLMSASLLARGLLVRRGVLDASERVFSLVALLGVALVGAFRGLAAVGVAFVAGALLAVLLGAVLSRMSRCRTFGVAGPIAKDLVRPSAAQFALSLVEVARPLVLIRVATGIAGDHQSGLLATAMGFSLPLIVVPEIAAQALFSKMTARPAADDATPPEAGAEAEPERRRLFRDVLVAGLPALAVYGVVAAWLLPMAKNGQYADSVWPLIVLLPGVLAHALTAHTGYVLLVRDRLHLAAGASTVSLAVTAGLAVVLLPTAGALGGAIALTVGLIVRTVLFQLAARSA